MIEHHQFFERAYSRDEIKEHVFDVLRHSARNRKKFTITHNFNSHNNSIFQENEKLIKEVMDYLIVKGSVIEEVFKPNLRIKYKIIYEELIHEPGFLENAS